MSSLLETNMRQLNLSASELTRLTNWPNIVIEDYLNVLFDLLRTVKVVDVLISRKFEGTANQIIITETGEDTLDWLLKLNTPQDIDMNANVEFASILLNQLTSGSVAFIDSNKRISQDNAEFFWDTVNKRLGVNTNSPTKALHVIGEAAISDKLGVGTDTPREALDVVGNGLISGNVGIGTDSPDSKLEIKGSGDSSATSALNVTNLSGIAILFVRNDGNVGIGTVSPGEQLEITKNFKLSNTTYANEYGIIYKGAFPFIHDFSYGDNGTVTPNGRNVFIGLASGNFTMGSTATNAYESSDNVGIGYSVLFYNTTGYFNVGLGTYALLSNTTGRNNTALGYSSGAFLNDGSTPNRTGRNNLFLGSLSTPLADGDTNEIVIGYNANGIGSNSVVLGNDSITKTVLKGNVGIGTISPATKAHITGAITIRELGADPANPAEGEKVVWQSNGVGTGEDGDLLMKTTAGGSTKTVNITQCLVPSGAIMIWSGAVANIPDGWFLCNGSNGTPDLRSKFVLGANNDVDAGTTGANEIDDVQSLVIAETNLPAHSHSISSDGAHGGHVAGYAQEAEAGTNRYLVNNWAELGAHTHGGSTGSVGDSTGLDVSPPFYVLAYIMKE